MPTLIDEPELQLTRRLFEGATHQPARLTPQAQFGGWLILENFLRGFEQEVYWPAKNPSPTLVQTYRAFVTGILAMGENLLTVGLDAAEREIVQSSVRVLRDKFILEFSESTRPQSEKSLEELFWSQQRDRLSRHARSGGSSSHPGGAFRVGNGGAAGSTGA